MNRSELLGPYKEFFGSPAGLYFLEQADDMIQSFHRDSEDHPDNARDNAQKAKGMRELLNHIDSVVVDRKGDKA